LARERRRDSTFPWILARIFICRWQKKRFTERSAMQEVSFTRRFSRLLPQRAITAVNTLEYSEIAGAGHLDGRPGGGHEFSQVRALQIGQMGRVACKMRGAQGTKA
jgi:hypothetical protein